MKPKTADVIAVKVMREQEWAYGRKLEHYSYREMARLAAQPVEQGGLGYHMSPHTFVGLVNGYLERMRETLTDSPDLTMARELADLDEQHRNLKRLTGPIDQARSLLVARTLGYATIDELAEHSPLNVVFRDERIIVAAESQLRAVGESRRKLLGTDSAIKVDLTTHDGLTAELNEMLAKAKLPPIPTPERQDNG